MEELTRTSNPEADQAPNWLISLFMVLIILMLNGVLIIGLLQMLSWTECLLLVLAGIALSCGMLFTIVTMRKLARDE